MGGRGGGGGIGPVVEPEPLRFEWDPAKSASNKAQHGVDFEEATAMRRDGPRLEIDVERPVEPRLLTIGPLNGISSAHGARRRYKAHLGAAVPETGGDPI